MKVRRYQKTKETQAMLIIVDAFKVEKSSNDIVHIYGGRQLEASDIYFSWGWVVGSVGALWNKKIEKKKSQFVRVQYYTLSKTKGTENRDFLSEYQDAKGIHFLE
jgi:hypothetical protein